jgi:hypothetical protein
MWTARSVTPLYDAPGSRKLIGQLAAGERVGTLESQVYVTPLKGRAVMNTNQLSVGEAVYMLDYKGEGYSNMFVRGKVVSDLRFDGTCKPSPACEKAIRFPAERARSVWWVKVHRGNGQSGWTSDGDFAGNDALGGEESLTTITTEQPEVSNGRDLGMSVSTSPTFNQPNMVGLTVRNQGGDQSYIKSVDLVKFGSIVTGLWGYDDTFGFEQSHVSEFRPVDEMEFTVNETTKFIYSYPNVFSSGIYNFDGAFQCTALISSYLSGLGFVNAPKSIPNGRKVVTSLLEGPNKEFFEKFNESVPPRAGSIISMEAGSGGVPHEYGHVAIVKNAKMSDDRKSITVKLIEQNIYVSKLGFVRNREIIFNFDDTNGVWKASHKLAPNGHEYTVINWTTPIALP